MIPRPRKFAARRRSERGYILITLILFVALVAITALVLAPLFTFQAKRDREEELIHRGTQYSRAMKHFVKKFGRYPTRIEELENTNQVRFLRRRYKDPITGKDFKLLHMGDVQLSFGGGIPGASPAGGLAQGAPGAPGFPGVGGPGGLPGGPNGALNSINSLAAAGGLAAGGPAAGGLAAGGINGGAGVGGSTSSFSAGSNGAVQALGMENDAPVVGPDAPTANSKMVKLDTETADLSRPAPSLRMIRTNNAVSAYLRQPRRAASIRASSLLAVRMIVGRRGIQRLGICRVGVRRSIEDLQPAAIDADHCHLRCRHALGCLFTLD